jgi:uncharacterized protein
MVEYLEYPGTTPFYLMAKPYGAVCNLDCTYCYYLEKTGLYPDDHDRWSMSEEVLELFIAQYIYSFREPAVLFTWHGGEPMMRGMNFFEKVIQLQKKYAGGRKIENTIQTNGTTLTDDWCRFFSDHGFLVGISVDGPEHCHDRYRKYSDGRPSFRNTMKGIELLVKHKVEFNTLSVVNDYNAQYPLEVYRFLKSIGSHYMQFTPVVERIQSDSTNAKPGLLSASSKQEGTMTRESVLPLDYGNFLISIFDEWVRKDVGDYYVITFDCMLANRVGVPPSLCIFARICGNTGVVEFNGDVYCCDHYVFPDFKLGNIKDKSLVTLMNSPIQQQFGRDKRDSLPEYCRQCEFLNLCNGECPKNRISTSHDGEPGLNYLCKGLKKFYRHVLPYLDFMANELAHGRPPSNVKRWAINRK